MIAEKIKEIFERDYLPIIREICDEVRVEDSFITFPLSKGHFIEVKDQAFHCSDKVKENHYRWKGVVIIRQWREMRGNLVAKEEAEFHVHGILGFLPIRQWNVERIVRRRLNLFVSQMLAETVANRLGLKSKKDEIYFENGKKVKVKFSPQGSLLLKQDKPKKVFLGNPSGAELLQTLTRAISLLLL
jgi:hypothetical protein